MKKKRRRQDVLRSKSVFVPIYPTRMGTPRTTPDVAQVAVEGAIPPSKRRVMHELKQVFGISEMAWAGHGAPSAMGITPGNGGPAITGPGYPPSSKIGHGGVYNFKDSPGLGFRTEEGWKIWRAALEIIPRSQNMSIIGILQAAIHRAGLKFGDIDSGEMNLLEMGIQWYLNDPGKTPVPSNATDGSPGGVSLAVLDRRV